MKMHVDSIAPRVLATGPRELPKWKAKPPTRSDVMTPTASENLAEPSGAEPHMGSNLPRALVLFSQLNGRVAAFARVRKTRALANGATRSGAHPAFHLWAAGQIDRPLGQLVFLP